MLVNFNATGTPTDVLHQLQAYQGPMKAGISNNRFRELAVSVLGDTVTVLSHIQNQPPPTVTVSYTGDCDAAGHGTLTIDINPLPLPA